MTVHLCSVACISVTGTDTRGGQVGKVRCTFDSIHQCASLISRVAYTPLMLYGIYELWKCAAYYSRGLLIYFLFFIGINSKLEYGVIIK